jgi:hypothetical protein
MPAEVRTRIQEGHPGKSMGPFCLDDANLKDREPITDFDARTGTSPIRAEWHAAILAPTQPGLIPDPDQVWHAPAGSPEAVISTTVEVK